MMFSGAVGFKTKGSNLDRYSGNEQSRTDIPNSKSSIINLLFYIYIYAFFIYFLVPTASKLKPICTKHSFESNSTTTDYLPNFPALTISVPPDDVFCSSSTSLSLISL